MALFQGTTQVCQYQIGKTILDFTEARDSEAVASAGGAYSKRIPRTNCALWIKKCAPRISSGIYF